MMGGMNPANGNAPFGMANAYQQGYPNQGFQGNFGQMPFQQQQLMGNTMSANVSALLYLSQLSKHVIDERFCAQPFGSPASVAGGPGYIAASNVPQSMSAFSANQMMRPAMGFNGGPGQMMSGVPQQQFQQMAPQQFQQMQQQQPFQYQQQQQQQQHQQQFSNGFGYAGNQAQGNGNSFF
jgi:hypothetical protein